MILIWLFALQLDADVQSKLIDAFKKLDRFEVRFKQVTYSDFFDDSTSEGFLQVARPGKMRMEYQKGDRKTIIWDGVTAYEYDQLADEEARQSQDELKGEPLVRILLYGEELTRDFLIDRIRDEAGDIFRLRPRDETQNYHIEMQFDENWMPREIEVFEDDGGTRLSFKEINLKPAFSDSTFKTPQYGLGSGC